MKVTPCLLVMVYGIYSTNYFVKTIAYFTTFIYTLILSTKGYFISSTISSIIFVASSLFMNLGIQKELTYTQVMSFLIIYAIALFISIKKKNLSDTNNELKSKINKDYLTGAYNKKYLEELLCIDKSPAYINTKMIAIEIQDFKNIINNYGYNCSQVILKRVAKFLEKEFSNHPLQFKLDGEIFVILIEDENINIYKTLSIIKNKLENKQLKIGNNTINIHINVCFTESNQCNNYKEYIENTINSLNSNNFNYQGMCYYKENNYQKIYN